MKFLKWLGISVGILLIIAAVFIGPMFMTMKSFTPVATGEITKDFLTVKDGFVNVYILKTEDDLICFDAGNSPEGMKAGFKELGLDPLKVKAVFLTHSDGDHVNALPAFKNAVVYLPAEEEPLVIGPKKRHFMFLVGNNKIPAEKYTIIKDSETVKIGKSAITAYLTPGHTPGSTSYLANGKYLSVGDLGIIKDGKLVGMPKPPSEEPAVIAESLKIVEGIKGVEYVATAHGGVLKVK